MRLRQNGRSSAFSKNFRRRRKIFEKAYKNPRCRRRKGSFKPSNVWFHPPPRKSGYVQTKTHMPTEPIQDTLGHLFAQTSKATRTYAGQILSELRLYAGQQMILVELWQQDGITLTALAEQIDVQLPTLTRMLRRLEEIGLIERRADANDQRVSLVYLTAAGHAIRSELEDAWARFETTVFADFSLEERVILRRLLLQIQQNVRNADS